MTPNKRGATRSCHLRSKQAKKVESSQNWQITFANSPLPRRGSRSSPALKPSFRLVVTRTQILGILKNSPQYFNYLLRVWYTYCKKRRLDADAPWFHPNSVFQNSVRAYQYSSPPQPHKLPHTSTRRVLVPLAYFATNASSSILGWRLLCTQTSSTIPHLALEPLRISAVTKEHCQFRARDDAFDYSAWSTFFVIDSTSKLWRWI